MGEGNGKSPWAVVALILALGLIVSSWVVIGGLVKIKSGDNAITVTGSAKKQIKSDLVVWSGNYSCTAITQVEAYTQLKNSQNKVRTYLGSKGIGENEMVFSSINTMVNHTLLPNGQYSNQVESYSLNQAVEIRSKDVDRLTKLARESTELINQGVNFQSNPPQYFYTKIADLKVEMLGLATSDANTRAQQIAENASSKAGTLRWAKMGVFQITPLYSNDISDYGVNDTSSMDKEITAVVTCTFQIK